MPILTGDVKLVASQVMNDVEEGGGAPTSTEIVDGTSNALFNDISELDRAGGRVPSDPFALHAHTAKAARIRRAAKVIFFMSSPPFKTASRV